MPLTELADTVGTTVPELVRDLTLLTMCGLPPFTPDEMIDLEIDGDVVRVISAPPALDRPVRLSPREARALIAALEAAGYPTDHPLVEKLAAALLAPANIDELAATIAATPVDASTAEIHATLAAAIDACEKVTIDYFKASAGTRTERTIHPYALVNERGAWYVSAYCERAEAVRTFKLDRIRSATPTGERFEAPSQHEAPSVAPKPEGLPVAVLRIKPGTVQTEERDWPGAHFTIKPNGAVFVEVPYGSARWVARRVVAGLGAIDAIETDDVRAAVCEIALEALELADRVAPEQQEA